MDQANSDNLNLTAIQYDALEVIRDGTERKNRVYKEFWPQLERLDLLVRKGVVRRHYELTEKGKAALASRPGA